MDRESSGSEMDSEEEEEEEEEVVLEEVGEGLAVGGGAINRQDSGFDGSIDLDLAQNQHDYPQVVDEEDEVFHAGQ